MKIAEIDFPSPLLSALRDGELVIFAGAGVSMGEPACLPSFKELAEKIAQGTGEVLQKGDPEDRFLGRLHDKGVKVHERAVRELSLNNPKPLESDEIEVMLDWLPHLTGVFPEAVDLAIQMPKTQWNAGEMLYRLEKGVSHGPHARILVCPIPDPTSPRGRH